MSCSPIKNCPCDRHCKRPCCNEVHRTSASPLRQQTSSAFVQPVGSKVRSPIKNGGGLRGYQPDSFPADFRPTKNLSVVDFERIEREIAERQRRLERMQIESDLQWRRAHEHAHVCSASCCVSPCGFHFNCSGHCFRHECQPYRCCVSSCIYHRCETACWCLSCTCLSCLSRKHRCLPQICCRNSCRHHRCEGPGCWCYNCSCYLCERLRKPIVTPTPEPVQSQKSPTVADNSEIPNKSVSKSPNKRATRQIEPKPYQEWTNTFSRMTVHWDKKKEILNQEKKRVQSPIKDTKRCCGNSPGKSHTQTCDEKEEHLSKSQMSRSNSTLARRTPSRCSISRVQSATKQKRSI